MWADSTDRSDACIGASELIDVELWDYPTTAISAIAVDEGLNIIGRYTDQSKTGKEY